MKARLLTAAVGVPLVVLLLFLCEQFNLIMYIAIAVLCSFMTYEILSAKKLHKNLLIAIPSISFAFVVPFLIGTEFVLLSLFIYAMVMFLIMIIKSEEFKFDDIAFALMGTSLIVFGMSSILGISMHFGGMVSFSFVLPVGIAWMADAGAFFAGVFLGKHKLCPKVSPKKTVEGFIGGIIVGTLAAMLIGYVYTFIYKINYYPIDYLIFAVMGFCGSIISVLGDLTFSQIKRACGIKDYGSIFPGHGGVLDRFDSVIFISPLIYLVTLYFM